MDWISPAKNAGAASSLTLERGGRDAGDQIADGRNKLVDATVEGRDLGRVLLGHFEELVYFIFLQHLRDKQLLVIRAKLFMIGYQQFKRPLNAVHS